MLRATDSRLLPFLRWNAALLTYATGCFFVINVNLTRIKLNSYLLIQLVHAFITSRIDYCNSLLYALPNNMVSKLQRDQNACAVQIGQYLSSVTLVRFQIYIGCVLNSVSISKRFQFLYNVAVQLLFIFLVLLHSTCVRVIIFVVLLTLQCSPSNSSRYVPPKLQAIAYYHVLRLVAYGSLYHGHTMYSRTSIIWTCSSDLIFYEY